MESFVLPHTAYLWVKWLHYLGFISWMAMLFYLPRLFVYHAENRANAGFCEVVLKQERLLYYFIGWVAMVVTAVTGLVILFFGGKELMKMGYFHAKLLFALILVLYHFTLGYFYKQFAANRCEKSGKFFRLYNELPTLAMFVIIWAMIVKPYA